MPGRTFFTNLSKFISFAAAPLVLTPFVRNQETEKITKALDAAAAKQKEEKKEEKESGGTTCPALLVSNRFSSNVWRIIWRIRLAVSDK